MNIPSSPSLIKSVLATAMIMVSLPLLASSAAAQERATQHGMTTQAVATHPQFIVQMSGKRTVNKGAALYHQGQYGDAIAYNNYALSQGLRKAHKTVVYSNQCAAFAKQERYKDALKACDQALKLMPSNWQALSNRASVNWLSGNIRQARQDIISAKSFAAHAPEITYNMRVFG